MTPDPTPQEPQVEWPVEISPCAFPTEALGGVNGWRGEVVPASWLSDPARWIRLASPNSEPEARADVSKEDLDRAQRIVDDEGRYVPGLAQRQSLSRCLDALRYAPACNPEGDDEARVRDRRYIAAQKPLDGPDRNADAYNVRQMLNAAMSALRDCEDYARVTSCNQPLADRCRDLHEQLTEDVINGRRNYPSRIELERCYDEHQQAESQLTSLRERAERQEAVLEFYADRTNWAARNPRGTGAPCWNDHGQKAAAALSDQSTPEQPSTRADAGQGDEKRSRSSLTASRRLGRSSRPWPATVERGSDSAAQSSPPDTFWTEIPCGHPPDPVAWRNPESGLYACHCGMVLKPEGGVEIEGAPGPIVPCSKCGCHVALPLAKDRS